MNFTIFSLRMDDHKPIFNAMFLWIHKPDFKRCYYFMVNTHHADSTMMTSLVAVKEVPYRVL